MIFKEPKIIFHHVPKCGGTSIVSGLAMTYYPWRLLTKGRRGFKARLNAPKATKESKDKAIDRYDYRRNLLAGHVNNELCPLISGHYPFDEMTYNAHHKTWSFITLLRDPVTRWYSEYDWNRHKDHEYQKTDLSIEEYLETLEGRANTRSFVNFYGGGQFQDIGLPTQELVSKSKETLRKMDVIGCLEHMDLFKSHMKSKFGKKPIFLNLNVSPAPKDQKSIPDFESLFHKKLLEYLEADIEIYHEAKSILGI